MNAVWSDKDPAPIVATFNPTNHEEHAMPTDDDTSTLVLPDGTRYPGRLQRDEMGEPKVIVATCGHCGFSWNDALITSVTPTPSGRCPNEYGHVYPDEPTDRKADATARLIDALGWETLANIGPTLTCTEVDALADFLRAHGQDESATVLIDAHAEADDEGDEHYAGEDE